MRPLLWLVVLSACDQVFGFDAVKVVDAARPVDAVASDAARNCTIRDTFDGSSIDTLLWGLIDNAPGRPTVDVANGALEIHLVSDPGYNGVVSTRAFDATGLALEATVTPASEAGHVNTYISFFYSTGNAIILGSGSGYLIAQVQQNGTITNLQQVAYSSDIARWRIRHDAALQKLEFEGAATGKSWTSFYELTPPFPITASYVAAAAGVYETGNPDPGTARFDELGLCSP